MTVFLGVGTNTPKLYVITQLLALMLMLTAPASWTESKVRFIAATYACVHAGVRKHAGGLLMVLGHESGGLGLVCGMDG